VCGTHSTLSAGQKFAVGSVQSVQQITYAAIQTKIYFKRPSWEVGQKEEDKQTVHTAYVWVSELSELQFRIEAKGQKMLQFKSLETNELVTSELEIKKTGSEPCCSVPK